MPSSVDFTSMRAPSGSPSDISATNRFVGAQRHEPGVVGLQPADDDAGGLRPVERTEYVSMTPVPSASRVTGTLGSAAISACSALLLSAAHSTGVVEYTPDRILAHHTPVGADEAEGTWPGTHGGDGLGDTVHGSSCYPVRRSSGRPPVEREGRADRRSPGQSVTAENTGNGKQL